MLAEEYGREARIADERVNPEEVSSIVLQAALARNGWKVIHDRCAPSRVRAASMEPLRGTESLERGGGSL